MYTKEALCQKIQEIYPDIGVCGIDVQADYDQAQQRWVVTLTHGGRVQKHFLEDPDAETCMAGKQCVSLGLEIAQLKDTIQRQTA